MANRGRPPKEESKRRSTGYRIRLTHDELEHMQKAAIDNQLTVAQLIRTGLCAIGAIPIKEDTLK